jgi:hypothetical protein
LSVTVRLLFSVACAFSLTRLLLSALLTAVQYVLVSIPSSARKHSITGCQVC